MAATPLRRKYSDSTKQLLPADGFFRQSAAGPSPVMTGGKIRTRFVAGSQ
jgi:hypothetical protein